MILTRLRDDSQESCYDYLLSVCEGKDKHSLFSATDGSAATQAWLCVCLVCCLYVYGTQWRRFDL